jgi:hypothetical protein
MTDTKNHAELLTILLTLSDPKYLVDTSCNYIAIACSQARQTIQTQDDAVTSLRQELEAVKAENSELKISRQREHDLRVKLSGEAESAEASLRIAREALKICKQALAEVRHAQEVGANWYTKTDVGLYMQVSMWVKKGLEAIQSTGEVK